MRECVIELASHSIRIRSHYDQVQLLCQKYLSEKEPEMTVSVTCEEIRQEGKKAHQEGIDAWPEPYLETLAVYRKIAEWMITREVLLFHGSAIAADDSGYLFAAPSGTGKSTHTGLWRELLGNRAVMINDDKPLLKVTDQEIFVCGTPWDGKHHLSNNIIVPLRGICMITRDVSNQISRIQQPDVWPMMLQHSFRPEDPEGMVHVMGMIDQIIRKVPVYQLRCNMELSAAELSFETMTEKGI